MSGGNVKIPLGRLSLFLDFILPERDEEAFEFWFLLKRDYDGIRYYEIA